MKLATLYEEENKKGYIEFIGDLRGIASEVISDLKTISSTLSKSVDSRNKEMMDKGRKNAHNIIDQLRARISNVVSKALQEAASKRDLKPILDLFKMRLDEGVLDWIKKKLVNIKNAVVASIADRFKRALRSMGNMFWSMITQSDVISGMLIALLLGIGSAAILGGAGTLIGISLPLAAIGTGPAAAFTSLWLVNSSISAIWEALKALVSGKYEYEAQSESIVRMISPSTVHSV